VVTQLDSAQRIAGFNMATCDCKRNQATTPASSCLWRAGHLHSAPSIGPDSYEQLMDSICKLLSVLCHADTAVKEHMCAGDTLQKYLDAIQVRKSQAASAGVRRLQGCDDCSWRSSSRAACHT
jgi:hypothetical protein